MWKNTNKESLHSGVEESRRPDAAAAATVTRFQACFTGLRRRPLSFLKLETSTLVPADVVGSPCWRREREETRTNWMQ